MTGVGRIKNGGWEECGCPQSTVSFGSFKQDFSTVPHVCLVSKDEKHKHYVFDREAYERACQAPGDSPLGQWVATKLEQARLFVARPPEQPPKPPEPWRFDEQSSFALPLERGWRPWKPENDAFHVDSETNFEMYGRMLDDFFHLL